MAGTKKRAQHVEWLQAALKVIADFNALDLREVELHEHGRPIEVPEIALEEFVFTGLDNIDFVRGRDWEGWIDGCASGEEEPGPAPAPGAGQDVAAGVGAGGPIIPDRGA